MKEWLKTSWANRDKMIYWTWLEYKWIHIPILELKEDFSNLWELYKKYK